MRNSYASRPAVTNKGNQMTTTVSEDMSTDQAPPDECSVPDCDNPIHVHNPEGHDGGLCGKHYRRWKRHGNTEPTRMSNKGRPCSVLGCPNGAKSLGLCEMHYKRHRDHDDVGEAAPKIGLPLYARAMRMVDTSAGQDACHPWTGKLTEGHLPVMRDGKTVRSARRVIAHHTKRLVNADDQSQWVRMRPTCDELCCNIKHMDVTTAGRPGTRKDA